MALTALPVPTKLTLVAAPVSSTAGQPIALTATLSPDTAQDHYASGNVTFYSGTSNIGQSSVVNGMAALSASLSIGTDSLTAVYSGDTNFAGATSYSFPVTVAGIAGSLSLTASPGTVPIFAPLTLKYAVTGSAGGPVPTGTVSLADGGTALATLSLPATSGAYTANVFPAGLHFLLGKYSGDATDTASN